MAEQLKQLAEQTKSLEEELKKAGFSEEQAKELSKNPEALQEALEKQEGLTEQQKQQLQQAAEAQSQACQSCEGMSGAMSKMAQGMGGDGMSPGNPNIGPWRPGESQKFGNGSGGPGKGNGAPSPDAEEAGYDTKQEKDVGKKHQGPIIGEVLVQANGVRPGEARQKFKQAVEIGSQEAEEAMSRGEISPEMQEAVKYYFGRQKARAAEGDSGESGGGDG
jgi:hypothetical protein